MERVILLSQFENRNLLPLIEDQIVDYYKIIQNQNEKRVLGFMLASIKSLIFRHNFEEVAVLIANFKKYLEITKDEIKIWENYEKQDIRKSYQNHYENNLKIKMEEANQFILLLQTELEREESEMNENIRKIFEKVTKMKEEARSNDEKYVKEKQDLENALQRTIA